MVAFLNKEPWFPDPRTYNRYLKDGLIAVGGDLSVRRLELAYRMGIFPWTDNPLTWWCPEQRAIFDLDQIHIGRSLSRTLRKNNFTVTFDQAFDRVIQACSQVPRPGGWLTSHFVRAYQQLHQNNMAHSVECWLGNDLVGGVYGVGVGSAFAGESMFYQVANASKVALTHLLWGLKASGYHLVDIQMVTPVTSSMGAFYIKRDDYLHRLEEALRRTCTFPTSHSSYKRDGRSNS